MEFETTLDTNGRQNDNQIQFIKHEHSLFQLDVHVDHSYHFQSYAILKNMTTLGKWEILTPFNVWNEFSGIDPDNPNRKYIKWEEIQEFIKKTIITYCEFLPKTEKGADNYNGKMLKVS